MRPRRPLDKAAQRERRKRFLAALERGGNVQRAAREAGLDPRTLYRARGRLASFAAAWEWTLARHAARHADEAAAYAPEAWMADDDEAHSAARRLSERALLGALLRRRG